MLRGLYIAAMGMQVQMARQDNISNNLANVDTTGFKQSVVTFKTNYPGYISRINDEEMRTRKGNFPVPHFVGPVPMVHGAVVDDVWTDWKMGRIKSTGNVLDLALGSKGGYFKVLGPGGRVWYTRNGSFALDADGVVVNEDGFQLLGKDGPFNVLKKRLTDQQAAAYEQVGQKVERDAGGPFVTRKGPVKVTEDGAVFSDGELVAQLDIVGLPDKGLSKVGYTYFSSTAAGQPSDAKVIQGYLEESNVSVVKEMVSMIEAFRAYEFNVKLLQTQDELLGRAVSEVGRSLR